MEEQETASWVEALRGDSDPDRHWLYRRQFLLRNAGAPPPAPGTDLHRLLAYSMVWSNHVFMGCRYSPKVMEKVLDMAKGIKVSDAPIHTLRDDLVSKVKKRGISNCNEGEEPCKKKVPEDCRTTKNVPNDVNDKRDEVASQPDSLMQMKQGIDADTSVPSSSSNIPSFASGQSSDMPASSSGPTEMPASSSGPTEMPSSSSGPTEMPSSSSGPTEMPSSSSGPTEVPTPGDREESLGAIQRGRLNIGNYAISQKSEPATALPQIGSTTNYCPVQHGGSKPDTLPNPIKSSADAPQLALKGTSHTSSVLKIPRKLTADDARQKQTFFNKLYKTVAWKLVSVGGFSPAVNHVEILNASMDSVKATLDVDFVPLKELADLPQNKSSQENIVCELRCKSVYLGTGCGRSKENAKAVAAREALKLFLKKKVVVTICKRKYCGREVEDLVLLDEGSRPSNLPPALRNPQDLM